jgi:hypothetical protein
MADQMRKRKVLDSTNKTPKTDKPRTDEDVRSFSHVTNTKKQPELLPISVIYFAIPIALLLLGALLWWGRGDFRGFNEQNIKGM